MTWTKLILGLYLLWFAVFIVRTSLWVYGKLQRLIELLEASLANLRSIDTKLDHWPR